MLVFACVCVSIHVQNPNGGVRAAVPEWRGTPKDVCVRVQQQQSRRPEQDQQDHIFRGEDDTVHPTHPHRSCAFSVYSHPTTTPHIFMISRVSERRDITLNPSYY